MSTGGMVGSETDELVLKVYTNELAENNVG